MLETGCKQWVFSFDVGYDDVDDEDDEDDSVGRFDESRMSFAMCDGPECELKGSLKRRESMMKGKEGERADHRWRTLPAVLAL